MASTYRIDLPNRIRKEIYCGKEQRMMDIVPKVLIEPWRAYCLRYWEYPQVARFQDRCAYLLLRDGPGDTLTDYKEMSIGSREIAVSSCPSCIQDLFYAGAGVLRSDAEEEKIKFAQTLEVCNRGLDRKDSRRKDRPETKFDRLQKICSMYPGCEIQACTVDTENVFQWREDKYRISDSLSQYRAEDTDSGEYYAMDRVLVVHTGHTVHCFLDQSGVLLDLGMVEEIR